MDISIDWQVPVQLTRFKKIIVDENELPDAIKDWAGVYFFLASMAAGIFHFT
jgi:hypothetical protein